MPKHAVVVGGGVAGMTAAHFLAEAGFQVTLCEASTALGGKAKSVRLPDGHPTEHSLRVYSSDYMTLLPVLASIPGEKGTPVLENLLVTTPVRTFKDGIIGKPRLPRPAGRKRGGKIRAFLKGLWHIARVVPKIALLTIGLKRRGVPVHETLLGLYAHLRLLWMCPARREHELGALSYRQYLRMDQRSPAFAHYFAALPRAIVAARDDAEAASIAMMMNKAFFHFDRKPKGMEEVELSSVMMLDGPTSERWIEPWARHLVNLGVTIHLDHHIDDLEFRNGAVATLHFRNGQGIACDFAILAIPYLALKQLATRSIMGQKVPHLLSKHCIRLEASAGMQCFLRDLPSPLPPQFTPGVPTNHLHSAWSFVTVIQGEPFWRDVPLPRGTRYILSATWSAVDVPGPITGKTIPRCTPDEILAECLAQCGFDPSTVIGWQMDHELRFVNADEYQREKDQLPPHVAYEPHNGVQLLNFVPLTILLPGANRNSPRLCTEISNLFLAGEAVYSPELTIQVPTMEKAASSGFLAARAVAQACGPECAEQISLPVGDPLPFAFLRRIDNWIWNLGRPNEYRKG